ncbi:MAG: hypothetical protein K2P80_04790 [Beijerinckiaceae bacterium]|nr:hypothetical protein [Beijerinckiaceae bacterium]
MLRFLNVLAIAALIGSATWAYSVKYDTIYYVEQIRKKEAKIERERDAIAILKAEWQFMTKPGRLQALSDKHLTLQPTKASQIIRANELPDRKNQGDAIAEKLEDLGLVTGSTPNQGLKSSGRTPGSSPSVTGTAGGKTR